MNKIIGLMIAIFICGFIISGCGESAAPEGVTPDLAGLNEPVPVPEPAPVPEPGIDVPPSGPLVCGDGELLIDDACQKCDGQIVDGECIKAGTGAIGAAIVELAQKCMLNPKNCVVNNGAKIGEFAKQPWTAPPSYLPD